MFWQPVVVWLKAQLNIVRPSGRDNCQPFELPNRKVGFLDKAQDLRIALKSLVLIGYKYTTQHYLQCFLAFRNFGADGEYAAKLIDPLPLEIDDAGNLSVADG